MSTEKRPRSRITVTEVGHFLSNPPSGFSVEAVPGSGYRVSSDPEELVLIDDFHCGGGTVVFHNSLGRKVKMQNLWEYTSMRKSLLSKRIHVLVSACEAAPEDRRRTEERVLQQYVLSIDGNDPLIRWQMERGLDWTISSVAGESYRVDIDLTEVLESWAAENLHITTEDKLKVQPVWRFSFFTLKYCSDALFDFPYWFGFSKRTFKLRETLASTG